MTLLVAKAFQTLNVEVEDYRLIAGRNSITKLLHKDWVVGFNSARKLLE